jgi:hypothetical protein
MRRKLIIVNAAIVLIVGFLAYLVPLAVLGEHADSAASHQRAEAARALSVASTQLSLDALLAERWLEGLASQDSVRSVFTPASPGARSRAATNQGNAISLAAERLEQFRGVRPSLVLFVDSEGVAIGRNDAELMRGESVVASYPSLSVALHNGITGSAIWANQERQEQLFVSFVPVLSDTREVIGALVLGSPANDERMERASRLAGGTSLALVADGVLLAKSRSFPVQPHLNTQGPAASTGEQLRVATGGFVFAEAPLAEYLDSRASWLAAVPDKALGDLARSLWPIAAVTLLGIVLVVVSGVLLEIYISRPIAQLEEGLLRVINGDTDLRFDLPHDELGGLVSRINSLLNALTGVSERDDPGE